MSKDPILFSGGSPLLYGYRTAHPVGASVEACDAEESCDGSGSACPDDAGAPDGTVCDDGDACTEDDACLAGICTPGEDTCGTGGTDGAAAGGGGQGGGADGPVADSGCGCAFPGAPTHDQGASWLFALAAGLVARRRRARS